MSHRRRLSASSLLLVLFASVSLGLCAALLSGEGGKLPCCATVASDEAAVMACCDTGKRSTAELPLPVHAPLPLTAEIAFGSTNQTSSLDLSRGHSLADIPYRSVDPQALLSTFLI